MKNPLIFILDENNDYLRYGGTVKALEGYHDRVVVITPQPISATTFISVSMLPKNRNDNRYEQYLSPTSKKPSDYIDSDDALSQTTLTWNVYEQDIKQDALLEFSQFRSGNISFAFAIQQISPSSKCVTYKGVFGVDNQLPSSGQTIGDYYECEDIDYSIESGTHTYAFSRGMLVYWNGSRYVKDRLKTLGGATAVDIPVEPNHAVGYELEDDETLAVEATIAQVVINENDIADLKQKDTDILDGTQAFTEISLDDGLGNIETITHASKKALDNEVVRLETDKADKTYVDSQDNALGVRIDETEADILALENANPLVDWVVDDNTYLLTITAYDGTIKTYDFPLETMVVNAYYDEVNKDLILVLKNGNELSIPVDDIFNGLATQDWVNTQLENYYTKVQSDNLYNEKIDKDFTSYTELTTDLSDDDYVIVRDISNNQTKKTKVSTLRQFETDTYEYGVRWVEGQSSSTLERVKIVNGEMTVGSATGLVANVGIDDQVVENSFDNINIFIRNRVVIDGNTMVRVNKYYIREYSVNDGGTIRNYILMCEKKLTGYRLPIRFDNGDGTEKNYAYLPAYEGYVDGSGIGRSISGVLPTTSISRNNSRIACRKNDGDGTNTDSLWGQVDLSEYYDLVQVPIWIEFANFDTQAGIGRGVVDLVFDENTVADSTVANTAIIANNSNFDVGMTIYLSTGTYHQITQIDVDTPIAGQTTITFNGATVTPLTGVNIDPRQYYTGMTDSVVASTGFYKANDGKHPFKWRGMENVWGNIWKFVDGVKISNWYAWVSTNPAHYDDVSSDVNGDYGSNWTKLSYQNALSNGYISEFGYDERFPFARLPIEVSGGSSTYYADYYYQNSGDRTLLVGGSWDYSSNAGLTFWDAIDTLGFASNYVGFRLSYRP